MVGVVEGELSVGDKSGADVGVVTIDGERVAEGVDGADSPSTCSPALAIVKDRFIVRN